MANPTIHPDNAARRPSIYADAIQGAKSVAGAVTNAAKTVAGDAVRNVKSVAREVRDVPTAAGTLAQDVVSGKNVGSGVKNLAKQVGEAAGVVKSRTESEQTFGVSPDSKGRPTKLVTMKSQPRK